MGSFCFMNLYPLIFFVLFFLSSCSGDKKEKDVSTEDTLKKKDVAESFSYASQLFNIEPLEFKLNKDDLPFPFDENFLSNKNVKTVIMRTDLREKDFSTKEEFRWDVNQEGQIIQEQKSTKGKIENTLVRKYSNGLLTEMEIANPGTRYESSIKKVLYVYSDDERLKTVYDIFENNDTLQTDYRYTDNLLTEKVAKKKGVIKSRTEIQYLNDRPIKIEIFKGSDSNDDKKTAIYSYTYTEKGALLYGDHWYPGVSNDSYIFEFDKEHRLREITYNIFVGEQKTKVPGKTKSYRFEYEGDMLKRINYFMQAPDYNQSGTFDFTYEFYQPS